MTLRALRVSALVAVLAAALAGCANNGSVPTHSLPGPSTVSLSAT